MKLNKHFFCEQNWGTVFGIEQVEGQCREIEEERDRVDLRDASSWSTGKFRSYIFDVSLSQLCVDFLRLKWSFRCLQDSVLNNYVATLYYLILYELFSDHLNILYHLR